MLNRIRQYIKQNNLLSKGKHLVTLSGGADSVCLLLVMKELDYDIEAIHCNFKLRGNESDRDEAFCEQLCREQNVKLHKIHFDTKIYAELHKISIEMAARELRYKYFEELREAINAQSIVVAHHKDDNVETVLLNMLRGTGIHGLEGMKARNGNIVRPMLCIERKEIEEYLISKGQSYITDSSNLVADVKRNKIRLNIMPQLKDITPAASDNIARSINYISEAVKMYDAMVALSKAECFNNRRIDIKRLLHQPSPEIVLYEIMKDYGFSSNIVLQIYDNLHAATGKVWHSDEYVAAMDRDSIILGRDVLYNPPMVIPEEGTYIYNVNEKFSISKEPRDPNLQISKEPFDIMLDADKVTFPITIRLARVGDRFAPYGMKGTKLISDYLTDRHKNYFEKKSQLVIEDANGVIVWLVGERVSQKVSIQSDTINILRIRYIKKE